MQKFTNPLDNVKIASPCGANWNEMRGDERKKYCAMCKLNVYNLSEMTQTEAENFLINSEGRVCVKFYRRKDGTVLTKDCPVGWAKIKRKVSRAATAIFALVGGFFGGNFVFNLTAFDNSDLMKTVAPVSKIPKENEILSVEGKVSNLPELKIQTKKTRSKKNLQMVVGQIEHIRDLKDEPVVAWIE